MVCMGEGEDTEALKVITLTPFLKATKCPLECTSTAHSLGGEIPKLSQITHWYEASTSCGSRIRAFTECTAIPEGWGSTETQAGQQREIAIDPKCGNCAVNSTMA